jgi:hypothetical protein
MRTLIIASNALSVGTFTMAGGSLVVSNYLIGIGSNAVGALWIKGGTFIETNPAVPFIGHVGKGQFCVSNANVWLSNMNLGSGAGSQGTFTLVGSTATLSGSLFAGLFFNTATGTVFVSGGQLIANAGSLSIGNQAGIGQMTITNGSASVAQLTVAIGNGSQGALTLMNSSVTVSNYINIGAGIGATGALWLVDSQLQLTAATNSLGVPQQGVGQMTLSNNSAVSVYTALMAGTGTITIQNGSMSVITNFAVNSNSTVWMSGGQLSVSNGVFALGRMTMTNGSVSAPNVLIGQVPGTSGSLTIVGGFLTASSSLVVGNCASSGIGTVTVSGGSLFVTNAAHTAFIDVRDGQLILNGGLLQTDILVMTNACGLFIRNGGTVVVGTLVLDPNLSAVGDGIPNGWKQQHGLDPLDPSLGGEDADGDGMSNLQEFLAGTDPTNSASAFRITSVVRAGGNVLVTWTTGIGRTNALQATVGGYATNGFTDIFAVTNTAGTTTNYLDIGGATNGPARFYRVRLVP